MTTALYPASFDPITFGHIDIVERAARLFDQVVVAVFDRPRKNLTFAPEERLHLTEVALAHLGKKVTVMPYSGLTVNFARQIGAQVIVRGLRSVADFEVELQYSLANHSLAPEIDTICLLNSQKFSFISSTIVKEIAMNDGDVSHLVPAHVVEALQGKYQHRQGS